jgi:hypothetical protein
MSEVLENDRRPDMIPQALACFLAVQMASQPETPLIFIAKQSDFAKLRIAASCRLGQQPAQIDSTMA